MENLIKHLTDISLDSLFYFQSVDVTIRKASTCNTNERYKDFDAVHLVERNIYDSENLWDIENQKILENYPLIWQVNNFE